MERLLGKGNVEESESAESATNANGGYRKTAGGVKR
jgi:hypothetical protein